MVTGPIHYIPHWSHWRRHWKWIVHSYFFFSRYLSAVDRIQQQTDIDTGREKERDEELITILPRKRFSFCAHKWSYKMKECKHSTYRYGKQESEIIRDFCSVCRQWKSHPVYPMERSIKQDRPPYLDINCALVTKVGSPCTTSCFTKTRP